MAKPSFLDRPIVAIERTEDGFRVATWAAPAVAWQLKSAIKHFETIEEAREAASADALKNGYSVAIDMASATSQPGRNGRG